MVLPLFGRQTGISRATASPAELRALNAKSKEQHQKATSGVRTFAKLLHQGPPPAPRGATAPRVITKDDNEAEIDFDDDDALSKHSSKHLGTTPTGTAEDDLTRAVQHSGKAAQNYLFAAHLQRYPCDNHVGATELTRLNGVVFKACSSSPDDLFYKQRLVFVPEELATYLRDDAPELLNDLAPHGADDSESTIVSKYLFWDTASDLGDPPSTIVDARYGPPPERALYYNQYDEALLMETLGAAYTDHRGDPPPDVRTTASAGGKLKVPEHIMRVYITSMFDFDRSGQDRSLKGYDFYVGTATPRTRHNRSTGLNTEYRNVHVPAKNYKNLLERIDEIYNSIARTRRRAEPAPGDLDMLKSDQEPRGSQRGPQGKFIDLAGDDNNDDDNNEEDDDDDDDDDDVNADEHSSSRGRATAQETCGDDDADDAETDDDPEDAAVPMPLPCR